MKIGIVTVTYNSRNVLEDSVEYYRAVGEPEIAITTLLIMAK